MRSLACLLPLLLACSENERPGVDAALPDAGGTDGGGRVDAGGNDAITVRVVDGPPEARTPIMGAEVVLDVAGGRLMAQTGADGLAAFDGVDLDAGITVTAYAAGHGIVTFARVDSAFLDLLAMRELYVADVLEISLPRQMPEPRIEVTGRALNLPGTGNTLRVQASIPGATAFEDSATVFSLEVPGGEPFTLVGAAYQQVPGSMVGPRGFAVDYVAWATAASPAVTTPSTVDIDFATPLATRAFDGSFAIPTTMDDFDDVALGAVWLRTVDSGRSLIVAAVEEIDVNGGRFQYTGERIDLPGAPELVTHYLLIDRPRISQVFLMGDHIDTDREPDFLTPPEILRPVFGSDTWYRDPVMWRTPDADALVYYAATRPEGEVDVPLWTAILPPGTTEVAFPELPPSAPATTFEGIVDGRIYTCDYVAPGTGCRRIATGRAFGVIP